MTKKAKMNILCNNKRKRHREWHMDCFSSATYYLCRGGACSHWDGGSANDPP
eukprot:m.136863 g.136863  ORF g.136863 m.136863 type:complete len:52 (+) comp29888_c0_seq2:170-325(+)